MLHSLKVAESSSGVTLNDRIAAIVFLAEIWMQKADFIQQSVQNVNNHILNVLKRASRDMR